MRLLISEQLDVKMVYLAKAIVSCDYFLTFSHGHESFTNDPSLPIFLQQNDELVKPLLPQVFQLIDLKEGRG